MKEPPRTARGSGDDASACPASASNGYGRSTLAVHSHTFPARSSAPKGLAPAFLDPTAAVSTDANTARSGDGGSSPQGHVRPSSPRAARSHSASDGRRPPAHAQNAAASSHDTYVTGCPSRPAGISPP